MLYSQKACSTTPVQTATWKPSPTRPPFASAATATLTCSRILSLNIRPHSPPGCENMRLFRCGLLAEVFSHPHSRSDRPTLRRGRLAVHNGWRSLSISRPRPAFALWFAFSRRWEDAPYIDLQRFLQGSLRGTRTQSAVHRPERAPSLRCGNPAAPNASVLRWHWVA